jgi:hypothetical protein
MVLYEDNDCDWLMSISRNNRRGGVYVEGGDMIG